MVNYPELSKFFTYDTQIHGIKVSFDRDVFKELSPKDGMQFKLLKDIQKGDKLYKRLSKSQKQITNLINDYDKSVKKIKDNYLQVCREKVKDRYNDYNYNFKIINYDNYQTKVENKNNKMLEKELFPFGEMKGKKIKNIDETFIKSFVKSNSYRKDTIKNLQGGKKKKKKKLTKKKDKKEKHLFYYFSTDWCGYCKAFNKTWNQVVKSHKEKKTIQFKKFIITDENEDLLHLYAIQSFPTLLLIKKNGERIYYDKDSREKEKIESFLKEHRIL